jgi:hypothetical protein
MVYVSTINGKCTFVKVKCTFVLSLFAYKIGNLGAHVGVTLGGLPQLWRFATALPQLEALCCKGFQRFATEWHCGTAFALFRLSSLYLSKK